MNSVSSSPSPIEFQRAGLTVFERGWLSSNGVLFAGDQNTPSVLVDTGYVTHESMTLTLVRHVLQGRRLDRIVNTHLHSDHCGGNHCLQKEYGSTVDVPAGECLKVDAWDEAALSFNATGQRCPRFERHGAIAAGQVMTLGRWEWQVVAVPGHDPESIALYQPELELLISADALWENGFGIVFPELDGVDAFSEVRDTLELLSNLKVKVVIPGHGSPFGGLAEAIDRARSRLSAFVADPRRHARHAAKALIKFRLLETRVEPKSAFLAWMAATPRMTGLHGSYFGDVSFVDWVGAMVDELRAGSAIRVSGDTISDIT
jgi:glyoxylase-like metal-dependent hydrolase (beta-lactamase superfamily II)